MEAVKRIRDEKIPCDAIFSAAGDIIAMGAIKQARDFGMSIPGDISIVGYDDIMAAPLITPALTTVKQPVEKMGAKALEIAVAAAEGKFAEEQKVVFDPELMVRESA